MRRKIPVQRLVANIATEKSRQEVTPLTPKSPDLFTDVSLRIGSDDMMMTMAGRSVPAGRSKVHVGK
jgi:hypothetical protein